MLHLKRVSIKNLLSFEHAEFSLDAYTVIVGPNNSGKTNLLRILDRVSQNVNLEYLQINRRHKLDPDEPSEIALSLVLSEAEAKMFFQCIFGQNAQIGKVSEDLRILDVTIFWDKDPVDVMHPKFTLYRFGSGFTIAANTSNENIAFDVRSVFSDEEDYKSQVDSWRTADPQKNFGSLVQRLGLLRHDALENKELFRDAILDGKRFVRIANGNAVKLPMSINYDSNTDTPLTRLIKGRTYQDQFQTITAGTVLNRIFEDGFTLVREVYPTHEELSKNLAALRNSDYDKYNNVCNDFKEISGGIEVQAEQDDSNAEQILFLDDDRRCNISDSASGYYALTCILCMLSGKTSGLVAIDEPEVHLHPEMVSRLHKRLGAIASQNDVQIVIITHSPRFVTFEQIKRTGGTCLIMVTRRDSASQVHADTEESTPLIKPHLFNPEIFFGIGSLLVNGSTSYFVQRAISDFYDGWFEKHDMVLVNCMRTNNISLQADLHRRFMIPYHCMADSKYDGDMEHVTKLEKNLVAELKKMGVECVKSKEGHLVYYKMKDFLEESHDDERKKFGIWDAFERAVREAGVEIPSKPDADT